MRIHPSSQRSRLLPELDSFLFPFLGILGQSCSAKDRTLVFVDPLENIDRIYPLERKY